MVRLFSTYLLHFMKPIQSLWQLLGLGIFLLSSPLLAQQVNSTTSLVAALTAANANPTATATITLASGTYNLTSALPNLAANNLTLQGPTSGAPAILDATGMASGVIFNVTGYQVTIANLSLRNARTHAITIHPGANRGHIVACNITTTAAPFPATATIDGNNCVNWTVTGNAISNVVGTTATAEPAIHFYNGASATTVTNNFVLDCDRAIGLGGDVPSSDPLAPTISTQPVNTTVTAGQTATFSVAATGTPAPTYQWYKNGTLINGATNTSYTTPATTPNDNGALFTVVVTSGTSTSTSNSVTLTVNAAPPSISTQPQSQSVTAGQTATFTVVASGTAPLSYQWKKNGTTLSGATSSSYTTPATTTADNGASFTVTISNTAGNVTSQAAILTVAAAAVAPSITTQPQSQSVTAGQTATFTVVASGTAPLSYQWKKGGTAINGATSASYTTPATTTALPSP
jgi:hypothetical protein